MKRILIIEDRRSPEECKHSGPVAAINAALESLFGDANAIQAIEVCDSQGAIIVMEERMRQQREENWTDTHDDTHKAGELAQAGAYYATVAKPHDKEFIMPPIEQFPIKAEEYYSPVGFPFEEPWRKIKGRVNNMRRAGAFIAAELDRLLRKTAKEGIGK